MTLGIPVSLVRSAYDDLCRLLCEGTPNALLGRTHTAHTHSLSFSGVFWTQTYPWRVVANVSYVKTKLTVEVRDVGVEARTVRDGTLTFILANCTGDVS